MKITFNQTFKPLLLKHFLKVFCIDRQHILCFRYLLDNKLLPQRLAHWGSFLKKMMLCLKRLTYHPVVQYAFENQICKNYSKGNLHNFSKKGKRKILTIFFVLKFFLNTSFLQAGI